MRPVSNKQKRKYIVLPSSVPGLPEPSMTSDASMHWHCYKRKCTESQVLCFVCFAFFLTFTLSSYVPISSPPSVSPSLSLFPSPQDQLLFCFPSKQTKRADLPGISTELGLTIRLGIYPHIKAGQGNLVRRKGSQEQRSQRHHTHKLTLGIAQEHQATQSTFMQRN